MKFCLAESWKSLKEAPQPSWEPVPLFLAKLSQKSNPNPWVNSCCCCPLSYRQPLPKAWLYQLRRWLSGSHRLLFEPPLCQAKPNSPISTSQAVSYDSDYLGSPLLVSSVSQHSSSSGVPKAGHDIQHVTSETLSERKNNFLSPADHTPPNVAQDSFLYLWQHTVGS